MCGIAGFITDKPSKENAKYFKRILYMSEIRGNEATGVFYIKDGVCCVEKQPITSTEFIKEVLPKHINGIEHTNVAFGHTRFPTQGSPKDNNNNHPVESENWVMIHNGSVTKMPRLEGYKYKGEVDSEILLSYIEKYGLKEGLPYVERGTAAVALINKQDLNSVYLWREVSPIIIACDTKSHTIFFASQKEFLEKGLSNMFLLFTSFQIRELPPNLLIKITINPFKVTSMGYVEVMKYNPTRYTYVPPKKVESSSKPKDMEFNTTTNRWEVAQVNATSSIPAQNVDTKVLNRKYLKDHGFVDSEISRMTPATVSTIMYYDYTGVDITITEDGKIRLLHKSSHVPGFPPKMIGTNGDEDNNKRDINKYYIGGMSKDFRNWEKLIKPNKGHISIDGTLIKRWDDVKKSHYIILVGDAIKEKLVDMSVLQADMDALSASFEEGEGRYMEE